MSIILINSSALHIPLADNSVQTCVTSPPYWGLRDYGVQDQLGLEPTPEQYVANMVAVFREVRRVLRDDGTVWLNLGDSYASGEIGRHDAKTDRAYGKRDDGERQHNKIDSGLKPKDLVGIPWRVAFALQADGWYLRSDIIWHKPNPMPESVTDRPTKAHEYVFLLTKNARYYFDQDAVKEKQTQSTIERMAESGEPIGTIPADGTRNIRTVWTIATQPTPFAHFATYPEKLVEPCIKAGSRENDVVLDPFAGSGTTGIVARRLGRHFVGLDLSRAYLHDIARRRLELDRLDAWSNGIQSSNDDWSDLPMFRNI